MTYEITSWFKFDKNRINLGNCKFLTLKDKKSSPIRTIDIMLAPDNNYVQHCCATMASVLLNCDNTSYIHFHIPDNGLSEYNKDKIQQLKSIRNFDITYYDISKFDFSNLPLNRKYITVSTYYRLYINEFMPDNIDRLLYLDSDTNVEKDLKELWEINLDGYLAGVCEDETSIPNLVRTQLKYSDFCFNAGVVLFNLKEIRKIDFIKECIDYYNENWCIITLQDQDILNGVFDGRCKMLPLCWNVASPYYSSLEWKLKTNSKERYNAIYNPGIIHFTYIPKPWSKGCEHPLQNEYWKYISYTPFKNEYKKYKLKNDINKIFSRIFSIKCEKYKTVVYFLGIKISYKTTKQLMAELYDKLNKQINKKFNELKYR